MPDFEGLEKEKGLLSSRPPRTELHQRFRQYGTVTFKFPLDFAGMDYFSRPAWQRVLIRFATKLATLNLFVNKGEMKACTEFFGLKNSRTSAFRTHRTVRTGA